MCPKVPLSPVWGHPEHWDSVIPVCIYHHAHNLALKKISLFWTFGQCLESLNAEIKSLAHWISNLSTYVNSPNKNVKSWVPHCKERVKSWVSVCGWHGHSHVKNAGLSLMEVQCPPRCGSRGWWQSLLLTWANADSVCKKKSTLAFLPQIFMTAPLQSLLLLRPASLATRSAVYNNSTFSFICMKWPSPSMVNTLSFQGAMASPSESPGHPTPSFL